MARKGGNRMSSHVTEATGLRMIGMYVQEYFHWGWQPYDQINDDGIDGEIIPRYKNGQDMGVRIKVQSKCGPSYISSESDQTINISPYGSKEGLITHIDRWRRSNEPVLLIYTNAEKTNAKGNKYLDLKNPAVWWIRMDDYEHDGSSVVRIPKNQLFQEHTKGELIKIIKPFVKDWIHCLMIKPEREELKLWNSLALAVDAKRYYKLWKISDPTITINKESYELNISRTGWRHITNRARKERVALSLRLLPVARKILEHSEQIRPVLLRVRETQTLWNSRTCHLGYRARVVIDGVERKVQVVLKWYNNLDYAKEKIWFYSVHIVK